LTEARPRVKLKVAQTDRFVAAFKPNKKPLSKCPNASKRKGKSEPNDQSSGEKGGGGGVVVVVNAQKLMMTTSTKEKRDTEKSTKDITE
jgi:hypothetical protein